MCRGETYHPSPDGPRSFDASGTGVVRAFHVDVAECSSEPMRLRWSIGWENVYDAIGGMPILVQDGRVVAETCSSAFCRRNPRTAIGWTASGRVLLVVIDGRQPRWSVGSALGELARLMVDLGTVYALNLDGGGTSAMWVDGELVNRPSDGQQRSVTYLGARPSRAGSGES